jgi:CheY-like chemotaxis protein
MATPSQKPAIRILVVEDSPDDFELLCLGLRGAPFEAHAERVEDEPQMAKALFEKRWDLVISDHHLPRSIARASPTPRSSSSPE